MKPGLFTVYSMHNGFDKNHLYPGVTFKRCNNRLCRKKLINLPAIFGKDLFFGDLNFQTED